MIKDLGHIPYFVFDGSNLGAKKLTENQRESDRERKKRQGFSYLENGNVKLATECFQTCIDITPKVSSFVHIHSPRII